MSDNHSWPSSSTEVIHKVLDYYEGMAQRGSSRTAEGHPDLKLTVKNIFSFCISSVQYGLLRGLDSADSLDDFQAYALQVLEPLPATTEDEKMDPYEVSAWGRLGERMAEANLVHGGQREIDRFLRLIRARLVARHNFGPEIGVLRRIVAVVTIWGQQTRTATAEKQQLAEYMGLFHIVAAAECLITALQHGVPSTTNDETCNFILRVFRSYTPDLNADRKTIPLAVFSTFKSQLASLIPHPSDTRNGTAAFVDAVESLARRKVDALALAARNGTPTVGQVLSDVYQCVALSLCSKRKGQQETIIEYCATNYCDVDDVMSAVIVAAATCSIPNRLEQIVSKRPHVALRVALDLVDLHVFSRHESIVIPLVLSLRALCLRARLHPMSSHDIAVAAVERLWQRCVALLSSGDLSDAAAELHKVLANSKGLNHPTTLRIGQFLGDDARVSQVLNALQPLSNLCIEYDAHKVFGELDTTAISRDPSSCQLLPAGFVAQLLARYGSSDSIVTVLMSGTMGWRKWLSSFAAPPPALKRHIEIANMMFFSRRPSDFVEQFCGDMYQLVDLCAYFLERCDNGDQCHVPRNWVADVFKILAHKVASQGTRLDNDGPICAIWSTLFGMPSSERTAIERAINERALLGGAPSARLVEIATLAGVDADAFGCARHLACHTLETINFTARQRSDLDGSALDVMTLEIAAMMRTDAIDRLTETIEVEYFFNAAVRRIATWSATSVAEHGDRLRHQLGRLVQLDAHPPRRSWIPYEAVLEVAERLTLEPRLPAAALLPVICAVAVSNVDSEGHPRHQLQRYFLIAAEHWLPSADCEVASIFGDTALVLADYFIASNRKWALRHCCTRLIEYACAPVVRVPCAVIDSAQQTLLRVLGEVHAKNDWSGLDDPALRLEVALSLISDRSTLTIADAEILLIAFSRTPTKSRRMTPTLTFRCVRTALDIFERLTSPTPQVVATKLQQAVNLLQTASAKLTGPMKIACNDERLRLLCFTDVSPESFANSVLAAIKETAAAPWFALHATSMWGMLRDTLPEAWKYVRSAFSVRFRVNHAAALLRNQRSASSSHLVGSLNKICSLAFSDGEAPKYTGYSALLLDRPDALRWVLEVDLGQPNDLTSFFTWHVALASLLGDETARDDLISSFAIFWRLGDALHFSFSRFEVSRTQFCSDECVDMEEVRRRFPLVQMMLDLNSATHERFLLQTIGDLAMRILSSTARDGDLDAIAATFGKSPRCNHPMRIFANDPQIAPLQYAWISCVQVVLLIVWKRSTSDTSRNSKLADAKTPWLLPYLARMLLRTSLCHGGITGLMTHIIERRHDWSNSLALRDFHLPHCFARFLQGIEVRGKGAGATMPMPIEVAEEIVSFIFPVSCYSQTHNVDMYFTL